jgi:hypothetical protein
MKDKRLHTFRSTPDPEYTDALYQRLTMLPQTDTAPEAQPVNGRSRKIRLSWAIATLLLMFALMAMVPAVRARLEDVVKQIGGLSFLITEDYPLAGQTPRIVPDDIITLEEARTSLDFEFSLPEYLPDGLTLQEDINASNIGRGIRLTYTDENQNGRILLLSVEPADSDVNLIVGPDSVIEVMVNDHPATIISGGWDVDSQSWEDNGSHMLRWELDGIEYTLSTGNEKWGGLSNEELIRVAESISIP